MADRGLRTAWWLTLVIAGLTAAAAASGLLIDDLYRDQAVPAAAFRGNDLATLTVGVPLLGLALAGAARGSLRAQLIWLGGLAYSIYNYAYYVYGAAFNDLFLLHAVVFGLSFVALGLLLAGLDIAAIAARIRPGTPVRWISALLMLVAASVTTMWTYYSLRFAATGEPPVDALPMPADRTHLGYALDLTLLVPTLGLAATLLWRRSATGHVLGAATCLYVGLYQVNYLAQKYFVADAVPGQARFDPYILPVFVLLLGAAWFLVARLGKEAVMPKVKQAATEFLNNQRIAVTGVSRKPQGHGANVVYQRLRDRGYQVFAVNPNADRVEGDQCYPDLKSIPGGVQAVIVGTRPEHAEQTVRECADLGIRYVWMHRSVDRGSVSDAATAYGREHGITVIDGGCPLMFDPTADFGHKLMRFVLTRTGKVPRTV